MATGEVNTGRVTLEEIGTPATPAANNNQLYTKAGGGVFLQDDTGAERVIPAVNSTLSRVWLVGSQGTGFGTTNNKIRRFLTIVENVGAALTLAQVVADGDNVTVNEDGIYAISYADKKTSGGKAIWGISIDSAQLTTSVEIMLNERRYGYASDETTGVSTLMVNWIGRLDSGAVIRAHTSGGNLLATNDGGIRFEVSQIARL